MAEFIKGRALSEDSAPLACRLRRFYPCFISGIFGRRRPDGRRLFLFPHRAKPRAAVPDRKTPEAPHTALRVFKDTVILIS